MAVALPLGPLPVTISPPRHQFKSSLTTQQPGCLQFTFPFWLWGGRGSPFSQGVLSFADYCIYYQGRGKGVLLFHGYRVLVWEDGKF